MCKGAGLRGEGGGGREAVMETGGAGINDQVNFGGDLVGGTDKAEQTQYGEREGEDGVERRTHGDLGMETGDAHVGGVPCGREKLVLALGRGRGKNSD